MNCKSRNVIELGTFIGYSAVLIASIISKESQLTSIKSDINSIKTAKELLKYAG